MRISSVRIKGFRCFDKEGQEVTLGDLTCLVGPNASGKTAAMFALARVFGESQTQRQVTAADFHLNLNEKLSDLEHRKLTIECRLEIPELESQTNNNRAVPETFNQMVVDAPGQSPYCRALLEAIWTKDGTPTGNVEQNLYWILTSSTKEADMEKSRRKMEADLRGRVRLIYVPSVRNPEQVIKATANSVLGRLLGALSWDGADKTLNDGLSSLRELVAELAGLKTINASLQSSWSDLYEGRVARLIAFQSLEQDATELLSLLRPVFQPDETGSTIPVERLSDGLRSLFAISASVGLFRSEVALQSDPEAHGFVSSIADKLPVLTTIALEEPENHLSPHYIGRVIGSLRTVSQDEHAQVIISSHSPSIMARIDPTEVRYFLGHEHRANTDIRHLRLPAPSETHHFKYVREAVRGFPELYFSRIVVLGEGPSEEIVLRRIFEAFGHPLDVQFVSIVPLGGRHVHHFWRLLQDIQIPYVTLLDFDREKYGAGVARLGYVKGELIKLHGPKSILVPTKSGPRILDDIPIPESDYAVEATALSRGWMRYLERAHNIFFMSPLDIDFAMLEAFPDAYKNIEKGLGPRLPRRGSKGLARARAIRKRVHQVLASKPEARDDRIGSTYTPDQQELFSWYKYLFLDGSKPATHMRSMLHLTDDQLRTSAPATLRRLVDTVAKLLSKLDEKDAVN